MLSRETLESMTHDVFSVCNDYNSVDEKDLSFGNIVNELEQCNGIPTDDVVYNAIDKELRRCGYDLHLNEDFQWLKK